MATEDKCRSCPQTDCAARRRSPEEDEQAFLDRQLITRRLCQIQHKIIVLSGKGGVGKSAIAVNLSCSLSLAGKRTGLLDIDIHGPSIPRMLNLNGRPVSFKGGVIHPVRYDRNLIVMSIGLLINDPNQAVIWRGPMKYGVIKQFLRDVEWGELDYLIIDSPPGTGDEPLSIAQMIPEADGAVIVTTPQALAIEDVRRSIKFCRTLNLPVIGVIENMSGFICPHCGKVTQVFNRGGGRKLAEETGVPFLGEIPLDPAIMNSGDDGLPFVFKYKDSETGKRFVEVIEPLLKLPDRRNFMMASH